MEQILLILAVVIDHPALAADKKDPLQSAIIEKAIRIELKKPAGALTKADLVKVKVLNLDVSSADRFRGGARIREPGLKEVANLLQLESLRLRGNQLSDVNPLAELIRLELLQLGNIPGFSLIIPSLTDKAPGSTFLSGQVGAVRTAIKSIPPAPFTLMAPT